MIFCSTKSEAKEPCRWRRRKEARPEEIIDAALALFVEKGFSATRLEDVAGCAGYRGPRKSVEQMDAAVAAMARKRK